MRLLIAEDQDVAAEGLRLLLGAEASTISMVASPEQAMVALRAGSFDLLLLDLTFAGSRRNGFSLLREAGMLQPALRTLVWTVHPGVDLATKARELGAAGFLSKYAPAQTLLEALRAVKGGGEWFQPLPPEHAHFTPREIEVACLLHAGLTRSTIATRLHLSVPTVDMHLNNLKRKLKVGRLTTMSAAIEREGLHLLDPPRLPGADCEINWCLFLPYLLCA